MADNAGGTTPPPPAQGAAPAAGTPAATPAPKPGTLSRTWNEKLARLDKLVDTENQLKVAGPKAQKFDDLVKRAKEDPLSILPELGLDWNALATAQVKRAKPVVPPVPGAPAAPAAAAAPAPEVKAVETKLDEVAKRVDAVETARKEAETAAITEQWNAFVASVDTTVTTGAEKFPAIAALKATPLVVKEIEDRYQKDKTVLTVEDAAAAVEKKLQLEIAEAKKTNPGLLKLLMGGAVEAAPAPVNKEPSAVKRPPPPKPAVTEEAPKAKPPEPSKRKGGGMTAWLKEKGRLSQT